MNLRLPWLRGRRGRLVLLLLVPVVLLGWWAVGGTEGEEGARWVEAEREDLVISVELEGTLRAVETSVISPPQVRDQWEFKIAFMAPEGQTVEKGMPVLGFDTSDLQQRLIRKQAESDEARKQIEKTEKNLTMVRRQDELRLAEAQARLRKARLKVELPEELLQGRELAMTKLDLELAEKEVVYLQRRLERSAESAEAQLAALRTQRDRADRRVEEITRAIEEMTRKAPRAGTVIYTEGWRGEKKAVGETCWRSESVMELPDLSEMMGKGTVDEADAGKLAEGQRVTLRLDAHPDVEFTGSVRSIWKTVQRKSWRSPVKVARLEIELDETDSRRMRPGMRFRGKVETERVAGALTVPVDAIFLEPDGPVVYRRTLLGHERAQVELGRRNEDRVEVLSGLEEGDAVSLVELGDEERSRT
jgi:multidrug efflux pump subunit AcrA (membrane-fusion protein)